MMQNILPNPSLLPLVPSAFLNLFSPDRMEQTGYRNKKEALLAYYEIAGPDYESWSKTFNMHFGYYKPGINPFRRNDLLNQMNEEVLNHLRIPFTEECHLLDMGCGLGATSRFAANKFQNAKITGITLVPWQVEKATRMNLDTGLDQEVMIMPGDYTQTPFHSNSFDAAYAIESSCYASGHSKADLIKEMYRVLKPGGKFAIADGFLKTTKPLKGITGKAYKRLCKSWALDEMGEIHSFEKALKAAGFKNLKIEDISWRVAPSVAHVPFTVAAFLFKNWLNGDFKMEKERWDNLKAPLLGMILGLNRRKFGYYIVTGTK